MSLNFVFNFPRNGIRSINVIYRGIRIRRWPTIENPWISESSESIVPLKSGELPGKVPYTVSSEDFKFVEKLIPKKTVPPVPQKAASASLSHPTPSGWVSPDPNVMFRSDGSPVPYLVRRSRNHMLPVYYQEKKRKRAEQTHGVRQLTVIRHIDGDMVALSRDLRAVLEPEHEGPLLIQMDEVTRSLRIEGLYQDKVAKFLLSKGF